MVEISTTVTFDRLFQKLPRQIQRKAAIRMDRLFHPSLRTEKLHPKHHQVWSFRIDQAYRIVFKFLGFNRTEFRYIGYHHTIYDYALF